MACKTLKKQPGKKKSSPKTTTKMLKHFALAQTVNVYHDTRKFQKKTTIAKLHYQNILFAVNLCRYHFQVQWKVDQVLCGDIFVGQRGRGEVNKNTGKQVPKEPIHII